MDEQEAWGRVVAGKVLSLQRLWEMGALSRDDLVRECTELINHERGCPEEQRAVLAQLRAAAQGQPLTRTA